ncbi:MAG: hypothetical protein WDO12_10130 [Pseudomonadota bacterium]
MFRTTEILAGVGALGIAGCAILGLALLDARQSSALEHLQAQDALEQGTDLNRIVSFKYVDERTLSIIDEKGAEYRMQFVAPCPGLKEAKDFSMATESYRNMDRFNGIVLNGQYCAFKDFAARITP